MTDRPIQAVLLAGGKGTRLRPYTTNFPKPLMPIGERPILEIVLKQLAAAGLPRVTLAVGHLAELITTFFGDGKRLGLSIDYFREDAPLGTAGCLAPLRTRLADPVLLMNGDILCDVDHRAFLDAHAASGAAASILLSRRTVHVDYGVVEADGAGGEVSIRGWREKPQTEFLVSTGIYALSPSRLGWLPAGERIDLPDVVKRLLERGEPVRGQVHQGYWLDIGRPDDYEKACADADKWGHI